MLSNESVAWVGLGASADRSMQPLQVVTSIPEVNKRDDHRQYLGSALRQCSTAPLADPFRTNHGSEHPVYSPLHATLIASACPA